MKHIKLFEGFIDEIYETKKQITELKGDIHHDDDVLDTEDNEDK